MMLKRIILGGLLSLMATAALAQNGGIVVSPTIVVFDGRERSVSLTLLNSGTTEQTYRVSMVNRRMLPDGQLVEAETPAAGEGFADRLVRYAPRQVVLPPREPQTLRILLQAPANLPDGEYRSHILLQQIPDLEAAEAPSERRATGLSMTLKAVFGITVPLIVRKGELAAEVAVADPEIVKLADGQQGLKLKVQRSGKRSVRGDLAVTLDGKRVGELNSVSVFMSTPYREVVVPLEKGTTLNGRKIAVAFRESEGGAGLATSANLVVR